jgi:hypothetical protein
MRTPRKMQRRIKTMREILFRAKAINRVEGREYRTNYKNGDWVYGLLSKPYIEVGEYSSAAEMTNTSGISDIEVDHETIGQFTGLTDKNGVKIFENGYMIIDNKTYKVIFDNAEYILTNIFNCDIITLKNNSIKGVFVDEI